MRWYASLIWGTMRLCRGAKAELDNRPDERSGYLEGYANLLGVIDLDIGVYRLADARAGDSDGSRVDQQQCVRCSHGECHRTFVVRSGARHLTVRQSCDELAITPAGEIAHVRKFVLGREFEGVEGVGSGTDFHRCAYAVEWIASHAAYLMRRR